MKLGPTAAFAQASLDIAKIAVGSGIDASIGPSILTRSVLVEPRAGLATRAVGSRIIASVFYTSVPH